MSGYKSFSFYTRISLRPCEAKEKKPSKPNKSIEHPYGRIKPYEGCPAPCKQLPGQVLLTTTAMQRASRGALSGSSGCGVEGLRT